MDLLWFVIKCLLKKINKYISLLLDYCVYLVIIILLYALTGCASSRYDVMDSVQKTLAPQHSDTRYKYGVVRCQKNSSIYIAYANDGHDDYSSYPDSGKLVMGVLVKNFAPYARKLGYSDTYETAKSEYISAMNHGYHYFVLPRIECWTDSYTLLTGVAAKVKMTLKIYNIKSGVLLDNIKINSVGSKMPGFSQSPQQLLFKPIHEIVHNVFSNNDGVNN